MKVSKVALASYISLAVSPFSFAQDMTGIITNSQGQVVANAKISIGNSKQKVITDSHGRFILTELSSGTIELHVTATNYSHKNKFIKVGSVDVNNADFQLHPSVIEVIDVHATPFHSVVNELNKFPWFQTYWYRAISHLSC